ncbi:hypothetical protein [Antrihabitans stalactiti]|uniref:UsfY protein n=1 Tax=Antrihabitans stalactiti TaxID=2584121 RepID=A0A848KQY1_9NOCA|nr:hypothetical protein [Antrihabitans stalactiti]NMN98017.1 hypothetical protein [Antrihabitans stalactiti]
MDEKAIQDIDVGEPAVPNDPAGWAGYVFLLVGIGGLAVTLVALGYGFMGWGAIGAAATVVALGAGAFLLWRAGRHNFKHLDADREA